MLVTVGLIVFHGPVLNRGRAADVAANKTSAITTNLDFGIFWPPIDPTAMASPNSRPLLTGHVSLRQETSSSTQAALRLEITIKRPADEAAREFWNSRLAFSEIDWMRFVRVWDVDERWLWPNLPYLLRLHGEERIERYGGVDPGKGVDNDFAAVLIRKYSAHGQEENESSKRNPSVSAEWYAVGEAKADKSTIVHSARSDDFIVHLGKTGEESKGMAKVWLVYADFLGAKLPASWPKKPEFAGGILAFFEVHWELKENAECEFQIRQLIPTHSTGFDWERWSKRARSLKDSKRSTTPALSPRGEGEANVR